MKTAKKINKNPLAVEYRAIQLEPLMLQFNMLMESSGKAPGFVSQHTGIATDTLRRWKLRKTRRPNSSTLRMAFKALGYTLKPIKE